MRVTRIIALATLAAAPFVGSFSSGSSAGAYLIRPTTTAPPVAYFDCKSLHESISKLNDFLDKNEWYKTSGDATLESQWNSAFDMMASMQTQGKKNGCYDKNGAPIY